MATTPLRLFVAIDLTSPIRSVIEQLQEALVKSGVKSRVVDPKNIHFTLKFLGDTPSAQLDTVKHMLDAITVPAFAIHVQGVGCFPNLRRPSVIWLGMREGEQETTKLATAIDQALHKIGVPLETRPFAPHTTLARLRFPPTSGSLDANSLQEFLTSHKDFEGGTMQVTSYHLKQSILTPRGPIYSTLHTVHLTT